VVEWVNVGELVCPQGAEPSFFPSPHLDPTYVNKFLATSVLACRRYLAGETTLHGSAVELSQGAVVFVGDSGAGKSTTAMAMVELGEARYCADGVVPIDWVGSDPSVIPVNDSIWLLRDAREWFGLARSDQWKGPLVPKSRSHRPVPLRAIVELAFEKEIDFPRLEPLRGADAFMSLSKAHLCYSVAPSEDALKDFAARERLASVAPLFRLRRSRSLNVVPAVVRLLLDKFEDGPQKGA
jgi:hypothetical protein